MNLEKITFKGIKTTEDFKESKECLEHFFSLYKIDECKNLEFEVRGGGAKTLYAPETYKIQLIDGIKPEKGLVFMNFETYGEDQYRFELLNRKDANKPFNLNIYIPNHCKNNNIIIPGLKSNNQLVELTTYEQMITRLYNPNLPDGTFIKDSIQKHIIEFVNPNQKDW